MKTVLLTSLISNVCYSTPGSSTIVCARSTVSKVLYHNRMSDFQPAGVLMDERKVG